eukprot:289368-Pleurochrysis_carterae.AAC.1
MQIAPEASSKRSSIGDDSRMHARLRAWAAAPRVSARVRACQRRQTLCIHASVYACIWAVAHVHRKQSGFMRTSKRWGLFFGGGVWGGVSKLPSSPASTRTGVAAAQHICLSGPA